MKRAVPPVRASHVNTGTSIPSEELFWPEDSEEPINHMPKLHVEIDERSEVTLFGGLALAASLVRLLRRPKLLDAHVEVLRRHNPFHESVSTAA